MSLKKPTEMGEGQTDAPVKNESPAVEKNSDASEEIVCKEAPEHAKPNVLVERESTAVAHNQANFQAQMADQGFEGLNLGFGSFPTIRLMNEGVFEDDDENELGDSFDCYVQSTRTKYLYKQAGNSDGDIFYSYDKVELVKSSDAGSSTVEQLKQEFKGDGFETETKEYLECVVTMNGGEYDGEMFLLSIPPASRNKFSGVVASMQMQGKSLRETAITCYVGKKRKSRRSNSSYFPWAFKAAQ